MKKRFLTSALSLLLATSCFSMVACGGGETSSSGTGDQGGGDVAGKTSIRVATYDGGVGLDWLKDAAKRFEEKYASKSFESGKTGVSVSVSASKTGDMLANTSLDKDVYLTEVVDYYLLQSKGKIADISDVVTGSLSEYNESGTIEGKLDGALKDFLTAKDGKYYGLPFYDGIYGFVYDVDMFEGMGWFFDESGNFTSTNKSKGMDGVAGTYDDGMPQTYAQFTKLVDKIRGDNVTPFVYAAESQVYFTTVLANYWADYEGKEDMQKNWTHSGSIEVINSFNGNTPVTETVELSNSNINDLQKQAGKYYALKFLQDVVLSNGQNRKEATGGFKAAQAQLIMSYLDGQKQQNPVAMVIDGAWFENEADLEETFETAKVLDASYDGTSDYKKTRKFAFMPIPMADDSAATLAAGSKNANGTHKQTLVSCNDSFCFVNAATTGSKLDVAKEFVKFLHTDAELSSFTAKTSITRPLTYEVSAADKANMSYFGKSLMEMKQASDIVYPYSNSTSYITESSKYMLGQWAWKAKVSGDNPVNPFLYMTTNAGTTAKAYFEGLYAAH